MNDINAEDLIKKIYGSVSSFCTSNPELGYYQVLRAIKNPLSPGYIETMKRIGEILLDDAQSIKFIDDNRNDIRIKILINEGSIKRFAELYEIDYHKLWRFLTGRCYNMGGDLRTAFINAGYIYATK